MYQLHHLDKSLSALGAHRKNDNNNKKHSGSAVGLPDWYKSWFCHFLIAVHSWTSYLRLLFLSFLICKWDLPYMDFWGVRIKYHTRNP